MLIQLKDFDGEPVGLIETNTDSWETITRVVNEALAHAESVCDDEEYGGDMSEPFYKYLDENGMSRVFIEDSIEVSI